MSKDHGVGTQQRGPVFCTELELGLGAEMHCRMQCNQGNSATGGKTKWDMVSANCFCMALGLWFGIGKDLDWGTGGSNRMGPGSTTNC